MNEGSSFVGFISDKRPALPNGQVGLFLHLAYVKQLQIKQGDLDKKKSCSCWKGMIHDLLLTYV